MQTEKGRNDFWRDDLRLEWNWNRLEHDALVTTHAFYTKYSQILHWKRLCCLTNFTALYKYKLIWTELNSYGSEASIYVVALWASIVFSDIFGNNSSPMRRTQNSLQVYYYGSQDASIGHTQILGNGAPFWGKISPLKSMGNLYVPLSRKRCVLEPKGLKILIGVTTNILINEIQSTRFGCKQKYFTFPTGLLNGFQQRGYCRRFRTRFLVAAANWKWFSGAVPCVATWFFGECLLSEAGPSGSDHWTHWAPLWKPLLVCCRHG